MGYFLRQDKKKKGTYLQMYETYQNASVKQARTKCIESFGYVDELRSEDISDPFSYYKSLVKDREKKRQADLDDKTRARAFNENIEKNIGYFLLAFLVDALEVKEVIDLLVSQQRYQFSIYDMLTQLIYSRIIDPRSKSKTISDVFPCLYNGVYTNVTLKGCSWRRTTQITRTDNAMLTEEVMICRVPAGQTKPKTGDLMILGDVTVTVTSGADYQRLIESYDSKAICFPHENDRE